jgi:hypothetical protein
MAVAGKLNCGQADAQVPKAAVMVFSIESTVLQCDQKLVYERCIAEL